MKLGLTLGYSGKEHTLDIQQILRAEELGFDSVWVAEAYGSDAATAAAWILAQTSRIRVGTAIMQVPARTPAMTAMTAMSLAHLSGERFILGLGASGPQVVEGWHGIGYANPLQRLREHIEVVRKVAAREAPLEYAGELYQIPYKGEGSVGLGKPLKSILSPRELSIYTASFTPGGFRVAGEVADGLFPAFASPEKLEVITGAVEEGFARASGNKGWEDFDIASTAIMYCSDNPEEARFLSRQYLALYIGGMGSKKKNFYNDMARKLGYESAAKKVQELYLGGDKEGAAAAIPDELIDEVSLCGSREQIAAQAEKWLEAERKGYVKTMLLGIPQPEMMEFAAELFVS